IRWNVPLSPALSPLVPHKEREREASTMVVVSRCAPSVVVSKSSLAQNRVSLDSQRKSKQSPYENATRSFANAQFIASTRCSFCARPCRLHLNRVARRHRYRDYPGRFAGARPDQGEGAGPVVSLSKQYAADCPGHDAVCGRQW